MRTAKSVLRYGQHVGLGVVLQAKLVSVQEITRAGVNFLASTPAGLEFFVKLKPLLKLSKSATDIYIKTNKAKPVSDKQLVWYICLI